MAIGAGPLAGTLVAVGACDDLRSSGESRRTVTAAPLASIARRLELDASELEPRLDAPAPSGDFQSEIDQFTTVDACAKQYAGMAPLVADALEAIGYDTFVHDACRVLDAAKAKDARRCDAIDASSLRARCRSTVAELLGVADACPWEIPDRPAHGRDPTCVAIASHDTRLCRAVRAVSALASCEAIASGDDGPCAQLVSTVEKERCTRDARRWRVALARPASGGQAQSSAAVVAAGELRVDVDDAGPPLDVNLTADLEHGLVVIEHRDGMRVVVGPLTQAGVGFIAPALQERATMALQLFVRRATFASLATGGSGGLGVPSAYAAIVEQVELLLPGRSPLATPSAHAALVAKLDELEEARGATLRFSLDGTIEGAGQRFNVHARGTTFVRDVVKASALYGLDARPLGDDGGMR